MDPLILIRLQSLMDASRGSSNITVGLIDGPVDFEHPAFQGSAIRAVKESQIAACKIVSSIACRHGTFIAGILCAKRGLNAPAICPGCTLLIHPIFMDEMIGDDSKGSNRDAITLPSAQRGISFISSN
jgi:subtilisin family serine protease